MSLGNSSEIFCLPMCEPEDTQEQSSERVFRSDAALHACVLLVAAVVRAPTILAAAPQGTLRAPTLNIIQPDLPSASSHFVQGPSSGVTQHAAEDGGIRIMPFIIANGPPGTTVVNFSPASVTTANNPDGHCVFTCFTFFSLYSSLPRRSFYSLVSLLASSSRGSLGACQPRAPLFSLHTCRAWNSWFSFYSLLSLKSCVPFASFQACGSWTPGAPWKSC